jgi:hypothetical protein
VPYVSSPSGATYWTGFQLEEGSQASPFEHELVGVTLSKCKRYYQRINADSGFEYGAIGKAVGSTAAWYIPMAIEEMRADPALSYSAVGDFRVTLQHSSSNTATSVAIGYNHPSRPQLSVQAGSNSAGSIRLFGFRSTPAWLAFDAEF